jgi:hypothetical protein
VTDETARAPMMRRGAGGSILGVVVRRMLVSVTVLLVLAALVLARDAGGAAHPTLKLDRLRPLTVAGSGFRAHESVRLDLHGASGGNRRVTASSRGTFTKAFSGVRMDRCSGFWVMASGSAGSRARLVRRALPQCPPA